MKLKFVFLCYAVILAANCLVKAADVEKQPDVVTNRSQVMQRAYELKSQFERDKKNTKLKKEARVYRYRAIENELCDLKILTTSQAELEVLDLLAGLANDAIVCLELLMNPEVVRAVKSEGLSTITITK